jgi:hypothetical protein
MQSIDINQIDRFVYGDGEVFSQKLSINEEQKLNADYNRKR